MLKRGLINLARYIVGVLFIFSGLIKVNDPVGTSIKLEEYFDVFSRDIATFFEVFKSVSMPLSVLLIVLEVVLGAMLLMGVKRNWTVGLLSLLILFFTFLTFYSAYFDKVTDCGCFGDAIKLTPWESFYKDIFLLVLIVLLFLFQKELPQRKGKWTVGVVIVAFLTLGASLWAINNLPFVDFRAYKEGVNITQAMQPSGELKYLYLMRKDGEEVLLETYPSDERYEFVDMQLQNPEVLPKIADFSVWNEEGDFTEEILVGNKLLVLISDFDKMNPDNLDKLTPIIEMEEVEVVILTASSSEKIENLKKEKAWNDVPYFYGDATVIKTMIRANPGVVLLKEGTILKKYHHRNIPSPKNIKSLLSP